MFLKSDIFQKMMVVDNDYHSAKEKREVIIGKLEDWNHLNNNINFLNIGRQQRSIFLIWEFSLAEVNNIHQILVVLQNKRTVKKSKFY